jgi:alkanesulfonate monooxygenase SsuD/methylene tetrahydromethanopterin reductase-like flavin-dependent oxidoreductase (luciferase family)
VSVEFGLFLPQIRMEMATIESRVGAAEEVGFHSVWLMDHLAPPGAVQHDSLEGWTVASVLLARTDRIRVGHLVLADPFRHPAVLAKMASTLDVLSGGRLELGLGWGSVDVELKTYGVTADRPAQRAARLGETLEVLELLFTGEPVTYHGRYHHLDDAICRPRPVAGSIPIHIGGAGPKLTMPLVARHADWWNCPSYAADRVAELRPLAGSARVSMQRVVGLAPSSAARPEVVALTERRFGIWGGVIVGTPDEVVAALRVDVDQGVELLIIQFSDFGTAETLRLFADEVVPAVRTAPLG